MHINIECAK